MFNYEFAKCMQLRNKLAEKIKGKIFVTRERGITSIVIHGGPTITYKVNIDDNLLICNMDRIAHSIEDDYYHFIINKFFNREVSI